jgi:hypothetical protein
MSLLVVSLASTSGSDTVAATTSGVFAFSAFSSFGTTSVSESCFSTSTGEVTAATGATSSVFSSSTVTFSSSIIFSSFS